MEKPGTRLPSLQKNWNPGEDKFQGVYPEVDWNIQLAYAEEIGMEQGSMS